MILSCLGDQYGHLRHLENLSIILDSIGKARINRNRGKEGNRLDCSAGILEDVIKGSLYSIHSLLYGLNNIYHRTAVNSMVCISYTYIVRIWYVL